MKTSEIIAILNKEETYHLIEAALKEAEFRAMLDTTSEYSVAVYADGKVEIRDKLAGDNSWNTGDEAVAEIGVPCYQYSDGPFENYPQTELVRNLAAECEPDELEAYHKYLAEYQQSQRDFYEDEDEYTPEEYDIIKWFRENSPAYDRLERKTAREIVDEAENDGDYYRMLDGYIDVLQHIASDEEAE